MYSHGDPAPIIGTGGVITFLWQLKGEGLDALGRKDESHTLLRAAVENALASEERSLLWRVHVSLGRLYQATDRLTEAAKDFPAAGELIEELAATIPDVGLYGNFLQGA